MGSKFLSLTDDELLAKVAQAGGGVMIGTWVDSRSGQHEAGLRNPMRGLVMALSSHDHREAAVRAAKELETRLDRLAKERLDFWVENLLDRSDTTKY